MSVKDSAARPAERGYHKGKRIPPLPVIVPAKNSTTNLAYAMRDEIHVLLKNVMDNAQRIRQIGMRLKEIGEANPCGAMTLMRAFFRACLLNKAAAEDLDRIWHGVGMWRKGSVI